MKDVMVDIETLGAQPDAAILSIGAVAFNFDHDATEEFKVNITIDSNQKRMRGMDGKTLAWWLQQSKQAQAALFDPQPIPLKDGLTHFRKFMTQFGTDVNVWANGVTFDLVILRHAFGGYPPWNYKRELCLRSIRWLGSKLGVNYNDYFDDLSLTAHDAVDDCKRQIKYLKDVVLDSEDGVALR